MLTAPGKVLIPNSSVYTTKFTLSYKDCQPWHYSTHLPKSLTRFLSYPRTTPLGWLNLSYCMPFIVKCGSSRNNIPSVLGVKNILIPLRKTVQIVFHSMRLTFSNVFASSEIQDEEIKSACYECVTFDTC